MNDVFGEILIVLFLTLLNGFFSMSEISLVTVRKTRIAELIKKGNKSAKVIDKLQKNPETLFATIQIGISLITISTSAFAGVNLGGDLANLLSKLNWDFIVNNAYAISFTTVVLVVSYISITIGELIPKSLGLRYAEPMALVAAYPIWWLSKVSSWLIKILNLTSNLFLKIFKDSTTFVESRLSEEEIRSLLHEGRKAGTIEPQEHNIIENVFDFSDLSVDKIMVSRANMVAFNIEQPAREVVRQAIESGYSRVPIYRQNLSNVIGILYTKRLLTSFNQTGQFTNLSDLLITPYFVPNSMKISKVLQRLQREKMHMALVTDEHGEIEGLVTLEDILEEIVGDITDETDEDSRLIKSEGDSFTVSAGISIVDFNKYFKTDLPENENYNTLSGFILESLGRFPVIGDVLDYHNLKFTIKEAALRTVKFVLVKVKKDLSGG